MSIEGDLLPFEKILSANAMIHLGNEPPQPPLTGDFLTIKVFRRLTLESCRTGLAVW